MNKKWMLFTVFISAFFIGAAVFYTAKETEAVVRMKTEKMEEIEEKINGYQSEQQKERDVEKIPETGTEEQKKATGE